MVRIVRRNRRPPLVTCLIVAFSFVAVGIMVLTAIIIAVIVVSGDSSSSDSSPAGSPGGVDSTPGASTTAPVSGGWSSGG